MSADATGWAYRHSPFTGGTWNVHQAIADSVNDQHENRFWMKTAELAVKARVSRATAVRALAALREQFNDSPEYVGKPFLRLLSTTGGGGQPGDQASEYEFLFPDVPVIYDSRKRKTSGSRRVTGSGSQRATGDSETGGSPGATGSDSSEATSGSPPIGNARVTNRTQGTQGNGVLTHRKTRNPYDVPMARFPEFTEEYRETLENIPITDPAPVTARPEIQMAAPRMRELREQLQGKPA